MLAVFFGTDRKKLVDASHAWLQERGEGTVVNIDPVEYQSGELAGAVGSESLFAEQITITIDSPSSNEELQTELEAILPQLAESTHQVVVLEGSLLAAAKKKYQKHAATFEEFAAEKPESFNMFTLAEALARKDKKNLWILLTTAQSTGVVAEKTIGILWWQLKALRLATLTDSAEAAGMKEYPYKKAKNALRNFKSGEVDQLSQSLLSLYHDAHQGKTDINLALEEWVLKL